MKQISTPIDGAANNLALYLIENMPAINPVVCGSSAAADVVYGTVRFYARLASLQSPYLVEGGQGFSGEQLECVIDCFLSRRTQGELTTLINECADAGNEPLIQALHDANVSFSKPHCLELLTESQKLAAVKLIQRTYGVGVPVAVAG